jgi:hypothetical protein
MQSGVGVGSNEEVNAQGFFFGTNESEVDLLKCVFGVALRQLTECICKISPRSGSQLLDE